MISRSNLAGKAIFLCWSSDFILHYFQWCWWKEMKRLGFTCTAVKICGQGLSPDQSSGPDLEARCTVSEYSDFGGHHRKCQQHTQHLSASGLMHRGRNQLLARWFSPRIDGVSLKTLSHAVWHYILNVFCYPGVLESLTVRQTPHPWNKNT